ncbi:hypothetical protein BJX68DRAFT_264094 [Aspergillus pseudodeflectus]|uniref:Uncharacterized protein n=1 Tax=Aspergillus pseudodeflectus TaxID=176178 RepID=A0ABR4KTZ3_9EURO
MSRRVATDEYEEISVTRNNGQRRFFLHYVLDGYNDHGSDSGQKVNGPAVGDLGNCALNDPQWSGQADPKWSLDATKLVYREAQTVTPACGGKNPLPCFPSKEPGGRDVHMVMATFTSRKSAKHYAGKSSGTGLVEIQTVPNSTSIEYVAVTCHNYSDDGKSSYGLRDHDYKLG